MEQFEADPFDIAESQGHIAHGDQSAQGRLLFHQQDFGAVAGGAHRSPEPGIAAAGDQHINIADDGDLFGSPRESFHLRHFLFSFWMYGNW